MPRNRGTDEGAKLTVIYWRDIPSQVMAQRGRERHSVELPKRFIKAIDSAAMFAGKTDSDAYTTEWRKEVRDCGDDLQAEAEAVAGELEAQFSQEDLRVLIKSKGKKAVSSG